MSMARSFFLEAGAYPKCMSVRMSKMKLAYVPWLISGRHRHNESLFQCELICCINIRRRRQPPRHPHTARLIVADVLRHRPAARSLTALAKKDLALA